jgi:hypothetical protein
MPLDVNVCVLKPVELVEHLINIVIDQTLFEQAGDTCRPVTQDVDDGSAGVV